MRPDVERQVQWRQSKQKDRHDLHARPRCFSVGQSVMARNFQAGAAWVPGVIVQQLGPLTYLIEVSEGRLWKRHIDQVKQYLIQGPLAEAGELDTPRSTREVPESDQGHVPETEELQEPEIQSELVPNAAPPHGETPVPSQATVPATPVVLPTTQGRVLVLTTQRHPLRRQVALHRATLNGNRISGSIRLGHIIDQITSTITLGEGGV